MSAITTHVLDTAAGRPAAGVGVRLAVADGADWRGLDTGVTDADGRWRASEPARLDAGTYRLSFDTAGYFAATGREVFFPRVEVTFLVTAPEQPYHVPVLLSPFAFSTYRGS